MAQRAKYDKEKIVAEWRTGKYSLRDLADRHKISRGTIHNLVAGIGQDIGQLVDKQVEINQQLAGMNRQEVDVFRDEVDERQKYHQFFTNQAVRNVESAMRKLDDEVEVTLFEHKALAEVIQKGKETVLGKDAAVVVNNTNTNAQQNNVIEQTADQVRGMIEKMNGLCL
jgi:hypothetical protein